MSTPANLPDPVPSPDPAKSAKPHVLGVIALVAAVVGFVFACIPGALIVGWVLLPIAFILSLVALFQSGRKWPAITGLILSIVGTIVGVIVFLVAVADAVDDAVRNDDSSASERKAGGEERADLVAEEGAVEGGYAVTIDDARQVSDYEGRPALRVDFTFTNHSDEAASFVFSVTAQAFQDGVELEDAYTMDGGGAQTNDIKEIKPGKSIKVQELFLLDGKADVDIEVTKAFDLDETMLARRTVRLK